MLFQIALIIVVATTAAVAQNERQNLVIDSSKPYVYLKFDHIANRKPLYRDESHRGLWLRLVNNCKIPVIVGTFDPGTGDPGIGIYGEEVVPIGVPRGLPGGVGPSGPSAKRQPQAATALGSKPPEGYSAEVFSTASISPGSDLLFSVPLNHVSPSWYMQITFYLDMTGSGDESDPYSIVCFHWQDIPEKLRANLGR